MAITILHGHMDAGLLFIYVRVIVLGALELGKVL